MQIDLKVKHQRILGVQQIPRLVIEKTTGFVYLNLEFDDEWDGCNIIVLLTNDRQSGNPVKYTWTGEPIEVAPELLETGTLRVSCVGLETDDQGETVQRLTTKRMSDGIRIHRAGDQEGVEPGTTVPGLWEQTMAAMGPLHMLETENKGNMVEAINEIKEIAEIKPNVEIGEVETGDAGTEAQVTNTGVYPDVKLNFVLPRGEEGADGVTPHIGMNGNWWLGAQDTGVVAKSPLITVESDWISAGNVVIPEYIMTITQPDGTKEEVRWNDGTPGMDGRDGGTYYPMLSEDGVLTFQRVGHMQPIPEEWKPTKIVPTKGVDYWTEEEQQEVAAAVQAANTSAGAANDAAENANNVAQAVGAAVEAAVAAADDATDAAHQADLATSRALAVTADAEDAVENLRRAVAQGEFDGRDGEDGVSPTLEVLSVPGGHRVYVVDGEGTEFFDVVDGKPGEPGKGLDILGTFPTVDALSAAVSNPEQGDMYNVGSAAPYNIYMYDSAAGWLDQGNLQGARGAVFTPTVDMYGNLSWSNDGGLDNPPTVSIKGRDGKTPEKGTDYFTDADKQEIAEQAATLVDIPSGSWNDLTDKPEAFPPATHDHDSTYLPLSGGKMTGELVFDGGDAAGGSKIVLETGKGQITNSATGTLFGFTSTAGLVLGHANYSLTLRGSSRPTINGKSIALQSEIPSIDGLASEEYVDNKIAAIPTPDVSGQISTHNTASDAHSDIRNVANAALPKAGGRVSGNIIFENNTGVFMRNSGGTDVSTLRANASNQLILGADSTWTETVTYSSFRPGSSQSKKLDLGNTNGYWRNLYLSGNLTDGTNSISVANIANKNNIPDALSDLADDNNHRTVTDTEKANWNAKANAADIATTKYAALSNSAVAYVKISDFGAWGTGAWYEKGFSMLISSRAGELIWVSLSSDDSNTNARAFRLINTYGKILKIFYSASESAIYVQCNAWCNNVCAHILSNINGDYVPAVASVSALASDVVEINIVEFGINSTSAVVGDSTVKLELGGSEARPTYNGTGVALVGDAPTAHSHSEYFPNTGGTMSGNIVLNNSNPHLGLQNGSSAAYFQTHDDGSGLKAGFGFGWANSLTISTSGQVFANSAGQTAGSYVLRNSKLSSASENPTVNGQICWKYK